MKQVRILSNTIAEELKESLSARGIVLESTVFEDKVSSIVSSVYEAVDDVDKEEVVEDSKIYFANSAATLGGKNVAEGEYVELEDSDEGTLATIYDADGELKEENIKVTEKDKTAFLANAEEVEDDGEDYFEDDEDEEELEEGTNCGGDDEEVEEEDVSKIKVSHGQKVKLTKNQLKAKRLRASGKLKKGYKLSADGKIVKMTAAEKKARKALGKKLAKKGKAQRKKSQAKAQQIASGSTSGSVKEGFDITAANGLKIAVEEGDELRVENNVLSVVREGAVIISGIEVHEGFIQNCIAEEVLVLNDGTAPEAPVAEGSEPTEPVAEAALLTFKANQGYVLVREGKELPMGNRIRARATLISEGFQVSSEMLDKASNGELVTL